MTLFASREQSKSDEMGAWVKHARDVALPVNRIWYSAPITSHGRAQGGDLAIAALIITTPSLALSSFSMSTQHAIKQIDS